MTEPDEIPPSQPVGLGGWLILVAIGLVIGPLRLLVFIAEAYPPIFSDGTWQVLTTPGSEAYHPLWGPLIMFELAGNLAFVAAGIWMLVLFFSQSARFPKVYIWVACAGLLFAIVDVWFISIVLVDGPVIDPQTAVELAGALIGVLIWVPYMLVSRRVRNTFLAKARVEQQPVAAEG